MSIRPGTYEVYRVADGWHWRLKSSTGRILASGEAFVSKAHAERAIQAVRFTAPLARKVEGTN